MMGNGESTDFTNFMLLPDITQRLIVAKALAQESAHAVNVNFNFNSVVDDMAMGDDGSCDGMVLDVDGDEGCNYDYDELITDPVVDGDGDGGCNNDKLTTDPVVDGDGDGGCNNDKLTTDPVVDGNGDGGCNNDKLTTDPVVDGVDGHLENLITHPLLKPSIHKGWRVPDKPFGQHHLDKHRHLPFDRFREIVKLDMEWRIRNLKRHREHRGL